MSLFLSTYVNKVDRKGRVSVPAQWRAHLSSDAFKGIVVFPAYTGQPCLEGMSITRVASLVEDVEQFAAFSAEQNDSAHLIFSQIKELPFDPEGRILLPADLLALANITEQAVFAGMGTRFQIWEPTAHAAMLAEVRKRATANPPSFPVRKGGGA